MTEPLALVLYEKLLPGSQLVNRLQDLNYRVQSISDPGLLVECAQQAKPLIVIADMHSSRNNVAHAIARLKANSETRHLPVIGITRDDAQELETLSKSEGLTLCVTDSAILNYLPQLLEQALHVD